jgi:hypothetical protein
VDIRRDARIRPRRARTGACKNGDGLSSEPNRLTAGMPFPSCLISRGHEASCSASILFRSFLFWSVSPRAAFANSERSNRAINSELGSSTLLAAARQIIRERVEKS